MIIGVSSTIGFGAIVGAEGAANASSLVKNTLQTFVDLKLIPAGAGLHDAAYAARRFALFMAAAPSLPPNQETSLRSLHSRLEQGGAVLPVSILSAFDACCGREEPYLTSLYFESLADALVAEAPLVSGAPRLARNPVSVDIVQPPDNARYREGSVEVGMQAQLERFEKRVVVRHLNFFQCTVGLRPETLRIVFDAAGLVSLLRSGDGEVSFIFGTEGEVLEAASAKDGKSRRIRGENRETHAQLKGVFPQVDADLQPFLERLEALRNDIESLTASRRRLQDWIGIEEERLATLVQTGEGASARLAENKVTLAAKEAELRIAEADRGATEEAIRQIGQRRYRLDREVLGEKVLSAARARRPLTIEEIPLRRVRPS